MKRQFEDDSLAVTLKAIFAKATTTVDGGWNLTFAVSADEAPQILQLASMRDMILQLAVLPAEENYG